MTANELIAYLKKCPEHATVYFDDCQGGLLEIKPPEIYAGQKLRQVRPDLKSPVVVLSPVGGLSDC